MSAQTAVVLLHGLCSTHQETRILERALKQAGHRPVRLALDGYTYDASQTRQSASRFGYWLRTVVQTTRRLRQEHERVYLAGISAGATVALGAALMDPECADGLILMSLPLKLDGWNIPSYQFLLPLVLYTPLGRIWRYRESAPYGVKDERVRSSIENEMSARRVSSAGAAVLGVPHLREFHRLQRWVRKKLASPTPRPPALALHARDDEVASLANVELLARHWQEERLDAVVLENSYHMITLDHDRLRVCEETLDYLRRHEIRRPPRAAASGPSRSGLELPAPLAALPT
ncbi:MAG: hypothetical protein RJA36_974 [Pseudomonadota bacterium]|jgi:carboxylesterase